MPRKGLVIRVDGEIVKKYEERVDRISFGSARGEIAAAGISEWDEVIDITVTKSGFLNPRLSDVHEAERQKAREHVTHYEDSKLGTEEDFSFNDRIGTSPDEDITEESDSEEPDSDNRDAGGLDLQ